jgi:hypothetical protein
MYTKQQREALYETIPAQERDAIVIFAIENGGVFDVLKAFLNDGTEGSEELSDSRPEVRFANMIGGATQAMILLQIATENGLTVRTLSQNFVVFQRARGQACLFVNLFP